MNKKNVFRRGAAVALLLGAALLGGCALVGLALLFALPAVAHNYRREHALNMWFVVAAESPQAAADALRRIGRVTGLPVHAFPKEREYFVELKLPASATALKTRSRRRSTSSSRTGCCPRCATGCSRSWRRPCC